MHTVLFIADRAMLGRYEVDALAAMQVAGPIRWISFSVFTAFSAGTIAVVARHVGAQRQEEARRAGGASLALAVVVGLVLAALTPLLPALISLYGAEPVVAGGAHRYLLVQLLIAPVTACAMTGIFVLQAAGDTRTPMLITGIANLLNIGGNWLLIYGNAGAPELGILGAALASAGALVVELCLVLLVLGRERSRLQVRRQDVLRFRRQTLSPILRISLPYLGEQLVFHSGFLVFTILVGHLGKVAMAANQAALSLESVCFLTADGFGIAAAALVGQKLGAGLVGEADAAAREASRVCLVGLLAVSLLFLTAPGPLMRIFTDHPATIAAGAVALRIAAVEIPLLALGDILGRAFRGAGQTRFPLLVTLVSVWTFRVGGAWLLAYPLGLGLAGIWLATVLDWGSRAVLLAWGWQRDRWLGVHV